MLPIFVQVQFEEVKPGDVFQNGKLSRAVRLHARIRAGRDADTSHRMLHAYTDLIVRVVHVSVDDVMVAFIRAPVGGGMRAGVRLATPGKEENGPEMSSLAVKRRGSRNDGRRRRSHKTHSYGVAFDASNEFRERRRSADHRAVKNPEGHRRSHKFENKEALGAEVIDAFAEAAAELRARLLHPDGRPPLQRLQDYFGQVIELLEKQDFKSGCPRRAL